MSNETADEIKTEKKPIRSPRWVRRFKGRFGVFGIDWKKQLKALAHFLVIALAFLALNWLFSPDDPGWLKLNPSPWVLIPLYLGFQHGFVWGIAAGLLQVLARLVVAEMPEITQPFTGGDQFLLWSMVLTGALGGFVRGVLNRQAEQKNIALQDSLQSNELLKSQVALLKHNEHELSNAMVSQGIEEASLTLSLRDIIVQNDDTTDRDEAFLNLIVERCGVQSAAIYFSASDGKVVRTACTGDDGEFPQSMGKTSMIKHAERTGEIVTQRWFWEPFEPSASETLDDRYLAVVANPKGRDFRVLIVSQMVFEKIHWENLWKLEAAFRWLEGSSQTGKFSELPIQWKQSDLKIAEPEPSIVKLADPQEGSEIVEELDEEELPLQASEIPPVPIKPQALPDLPEVSSLEPITKPLSEVDLIAELEAEVAPLYNPVGLESPTDDLVIEQQKVEEQLLIEPFSDTVAVVSRAILGPSEFRQRLAECRQTELGSENRYRLIVFVPDRDETVERIDHFANSLSEVLAPTDDLAKIPAEGGAYVYGLITAAESNQFAEQYTGVLLKRVYEIRLRFFVLTLDDPALGAFEN